MKWIKPWLIFESKDINGSIIDEQVIEILSHSGWKKIDPPTDENWDVQLVYKISDNIFIDMLSLKESSTDSLIYYMRKGDNRFIYINPDNFSEIYSKHVSLYKKLSNYERMMKICNYLLPFFEDEPDDKTKDNIRECFYEIEDILSIEPEISWGYITGRHVNNGLEFGFFPAFRFSDKLGLFLEYRHNGIKKSDQLSIEEEFENSKEKLKYYDIEPYRCEMINDDDWRIIIKILF